MSNGFTEKQLGDLKSSKRRIYVRTIRNKSHEYVVDTELSDEVLDRLNDLSSMRMTSICTGHGERQPKIYLFNRCGYTSTFIKYASMIMTSLPDIDCELSLFNTKFECRMILRPIRTITTEEVCLSGSLEWVRKTVHTLEELDAALVTCKHTEEDIREAKTNTDT